MNNFVLGVLINLTSTVLFWMLGGLFIWFCVSNKQRRLHNFFGISRPPQIYIYLSSLEIPAQAITGYNNNVNPDKIIALGAGEFDLVPLISEILARRSFIVAETFAGLIDSLFSVTRPRIEFRCAPKDDLEKNLPKSATICIGSPQHNAVTGHYLDNCCPPATFVREKEYSGDFTILFRGKDNATDPDRHEDFIPIDNIKGWLEQQK